MNELRATIEIMAEIISGLRQEKAALIEVIGQKDRELSDLRTNVAELSATEPDA
jgi:predicted nuclease with TOPRIM domain